MNKKPILTETEIKQMVLRGYAKFAVNDHEFGESVATIRNVEHVEPRPGVHHDEPFDWITWTLSSPRIIGDVAQYQQSIETLVDYLVENGAREHWTVGS